MAGALHAVRAPSARPLRGHAAGSTNAVKLSRGARAATSFGGRWFHCTAKAFHGFAELDCLDGLGCVGGGVS
jgi:hypothetical protein